MMKLYRSPCHCAFVLACLLVVAAFCFCPSVGADTPCREAEVSGAELMPAPKGLCLGQACLGDGENREESRIAVTEGTRIVLAEPIVLERGAEVELTGGVLETPGGLTLGCTAGNFGGRLMIRNGELMTPSITLLNNNENVVAISGGTLTITGNKAFTHDGLHDLSNVTISNATLRTAGRSWSLNCGTVLTDVVIAAEQGKSITIGTEGAATVGRCTLTNEGLLLLGGDVTLALTDNRGRIDFREHTLCLTEATEKGGVVTGTGELRLAPGTSLFRSLKAGTLKLASLGTTLSVAGGDGLTADKVVLGHLRSSISADSLGKETMAFYADSVELVEGCYTLLSLARAQNLTDVTLTHKGQVISVEDAPVLIRGTSYWLDLVLSPDGRSLQLIVTERPAPSTFSFFALTGRVLGRRRN